MTYLSRKAFAATANNGKKIGIEENREVRIHIPSSHYHNEIGEVTRTGVAESGVAYAEVSLRYGLKPIRFAQRALSTNLAPAPQRPNKKPSARSRGRGSLDRFGLFKN